MKWKICSSAVQSVYESIWTCLLKYFTYFPLQLPSTFEKLHFFQMFPFSQCYFICLSICGCFRLQGSDKYKLACQLNALQCDIFKGKNAQLLQCVCHNVLLPLGSWCFDIKPAVAACSVPPLRTCWEPGPLPRSCLLALGSVELYVTRSLNPT